MKKRTRKLISILLTLALLATLLVPMAAPAAASGTLSAITTPTVADAINQTLGTVKVVVPAGSVASGDSVIFKLPGGYDFSATGGAFNTTPQTDPTAVAGNILYVPAAIGTGAGEVNGITAPNISIAVLDPNDEIKLTATANQSMIQDFIFYVYLRDIDVEADTTKDCVVTFDAAGSSGFPSGTVTAGKVASSGALTLTASGADTSNNVFTFDLRVKEEVLGSLEVDDSSVKLVLPDGYEWSTNGTISTLWGSNIAATIAVNAAGDELSIDFNGPNATTVASAWDITGLRFTVSDEKKVKSGDVVVKVKGESTSSPSTLVVGTYGDYNATISAKDTPTVYAGKTEQEVGDLVIKESIAQSLVNGRYITLTLPSFARWTDVPDSVSNEAVTLDFAGLSGSDGNIIKYTITNTGGGDPAELKFEDMEVLLDLAAPGDLKVTLGGTSGLTGEVAFAKMATSVTAKAEAKPEVKIGMSAQKIGDIVITEAAAGAIEEGTLWIKVPQGVEFAKLPKVEVVSGDLGIDMAMINRSKPASTDFYQFVNIPIDNDSNEVSTIKISEIYVTVDRTVAEGDLKVAIGGAAVLESNGAPLRGWFADVTGVGAGVNSGVAMVADINDDSTGDYAAGASLFPATAAYTAAAAGTVVTPAPGETKASASFVIGATKYNVGGVEKEMDVAPYVRDGRTFLPVRFVAEALGVSSDNILWDEANQTVTLLKGDKVVQVKIGSKAMIVNGATITMDVAAEITSGRTMLPFRFIAQALGASVAWDEATQTVTLK